MSDDHTTHLRLMWQFLKVRISPLVHSGLQFLPMWEKHLLAVSHNVLLLMAVYKLTPWILGPLILHDMHPLLHVNKTSSGEMPNTDCS